MSTMEYRLAFHSRDGRIIPWSGERYASVEEANERREMIASVTHEGMRSKLFIERRSVTDWTPVEGR